MRTKKIFFLILSAILASSCSNEIGRCDLTDAQMQIIPYEKGQVISFIDSTGLTVDFTVIENELSWRQETAGNAFYGEYTAHRTKFVRLKSEQVILKFSCIFLPVNVCANTTIVIFILGVKSLCQMEERLQ